ncbi:MAG TPA: twin-arginine translocase subunit TatC [Candidatus Angelobacter sp.]|nr:twin-arginine translocase subunit TatC [Candidatus Angelobacter sp.]
MADSTEELRPEEDGGGPVKTFLEHLEDLRWMLIKSGAALLVGMIVCLYATHQVVSVLKRPLQRAALIQVGHTQKALVRLGTNTLATLDSPTNRVGSLDLGTNRLVIIQVEPFETGTNILVSLRVDTNPPLEDLLASATDLVYLDPAAPFLSSLHLAFFAGILLAAPFIIYFVAQFVLPALKIREKKYVLRAFGVGVGLFLVGVCFCYFFVLARALKFAELFALWMGVKVPVWRAETYFSFVTKFMLGMGLGFELPVVLLALVKIGILDYKKLSAMRRYMVVINLVLGALLTTPEVFTQVVMAIVLQMLYEISVWIAWYWERKERKQAAEA